ncbi:nicotinate-nicotinamide nucleotide adenylyltransferase [Thaumasiovibrio subtropicus]|uniref:nicotinate-nicotinamide nucleotide adenylyltransferase n=1 Tax=Thaumasiovibrio subtropicus TaxID=1891207 RepID=UPI001FE2D52D|nr:nicotinate-nicotinamide nucleotide adenylyltransferase [Thaumasiovibrio subtropicus]
MKKIAIFGSAFNPPTKGHLSVVSRLTHFDEVWMMPSFAHAWGKSMAPFELRCEWVRVFIEDSGLSNLVLRTDEQNFAKGGEAVTTYAVLSAFSAKFDDHEFTFVVGPDNFLNFSKFHRSDDILAKWSVLACPQTVDIRSTYVRNAVLEGNNVSHWLTPGVEHCLEAVRDELSEIWK